MTINNTTTTAVTVTNTANATSTANATETRTKTYDQLKGIAGWVRSTNKDAVHNLAVAIMGYRRQYGSAGIANFAKSWLEPTLQRTVADLQAKGYTVAFKQVGAELGYRNYLFDVSKDDTTSDVLYVAHYDTVDRDTGTAQTRWSKNTAQTVASEHQMKYKAVSVKDGIAYLDMTQSANDGAGCLGADDGAGLAVMINLMAHGVLGGYCFTTGEECGGIGAEAVRTQAEPFLKQYNYSIEIDRRGFDDVVWAQSVGECASITHAQWLCDQLNKHKMPRGNFKPSDLGSYTDVATFADIIPENINIASGYINAHSSNEQVHLPYLDALADALAGLDWSSAKVTRVAGDFGVPSYSYGGYGYDYYDYPYYGSRGNSKGVSKATGASYKREISDTDIAKIFLMHTDFMRYALSYGAVTYDDLDALAEEFFGYNLDLVLESHEGLF